ncbi:putative cysteine synthase A, partial [Trichinella spiralis]|uniref:putative cysteine synthase A n=1 Tax=Trichinella spiralis TaxID=6334 RepID=UPI0001EFD247
SACEKFLAFFAGQSCAAFEKSLNWTDIDDDGDECWNETGLQEGGSASPTLSSHVEEEEEDGTKTIEPTIQMNIEKMKRAIESDYIRTDQRAAEDANFCMVIGFGWQRRRGQPEARRFRPTSKPTTKIWCNSLPPVDTITCSKAAAPTSTACWTRWSPRAWPAVDSPVGSVQRREPLLEHGLPRPHANDRAHAQAHVDSAHCHAGRRSLAGHGHRQLQHHAYILIRPVHSSPRLRRQYARTGHAPADRRRWIDDGSGTVELITAAAAADSDRQSGSQFFTFLQLEDKFGELNVKKRQIIEPAFLFFSL